MPRKIVQAQGEAWTAPGKLVGNGAYLLKAHDLGVSISLEKNPTYWDAAHVLLQRVKGVTIADPEEALKRYRAGGLDRVQIPAGDDRKLREERPGEVVSMPYACTYAYLVNLAENAPAALHDQRVRQALAYAIQPEVVVEQILRAASARRQAGRIGRSRGFTHPSPRRPAGAPLNASRKPRNCWPRRAMVPIIH